MVKKAKKQKLNKETYRSLSDIIISDDIDEFKKLVREKDIKNIKDLQTKYPAHFACKHNAVKILDYSISHKLISPLELDDNDKTFIHAAAFTDNNEALSLVLSSNAGIYLESTTAEGATALYGAVKHGHLGAVNLLALNGANINTRNWKEEGATPLCLAAQSNNLDMMQLLLNNGAEIECGTFGKITPLCFAARSGNLEAVQFLHSKGANPAQLSTFGHSPLSLASGNGHTKVIKYFLDIDSLPKIHIKNAIYEAVSKGHFKPLTLLLNHYSVQNDSPLLYIAVENKNYDIIDLLLAHNINVNFSSRSSDTALHIAAKNNGILTAQKLVKHGALLNSLNLKWMTPLHEAVQKGYIEFAELLLSFGANPDIKLKNGITPMHTAIMAQDSKMVLLLIQYKARIDLKTSNECPAPNSTATEIAKKYGDQEIVEILNIALKLDERLQNNLGNNHLSTAGSPEIHDNLNLNGLGHSGFPTPPLFGEYENLNLNFGP